MALSSSSSLTWLYDIFPSFSGEDVRVTFLSHFLKELDRKLIIAFKDNQIQRSHSIAPELVHAIKSSRIAVVIFSKNYASSSWCLNELLEIVKCKEECGQMVIPVFYGLDPSHVRKQTGEFGQIFEETCHNKTDEVIIKWQRALTDVANILGYHSVNWGNEANMIEEIVSDVLEKLLLTPSKDSEDFVGIEDHIAKMSVLLQLESEEVRMVGLWGSSGIGKTTIARVLFQRLSRHFQGSVFIDNAFLSKSLDIYSKANPDDYNMKLHLQGHFLSKILGKGDIKINHLSAIRERLKHQKVIIFIDDFNDQVVLDSLVGKTQWFGRGSRIILVTNDKHLLRSHGIDHIYKVRLPSRDLTREMLCQFAFRENSPPEGFEELVAKVAHHVGRLPLALSVLGSSLRGRDKEYWMDLLPRLQNGIDGKIEKTLRVSYDGLSSEEDKAIFRYIACYFNGAKVKYIKWLLADSGLDVDVGLKNLADKSLIDVKSLGTVWMHRLLQKMGKEVVRLEKPENRGFLDDSQDIYDVLSKGIGTQKILGISLDIDEIDELCAHENAFIGMRNLRFLKVSSKYRLDNDKLQIPKSFNYLPSTLKLLCWSGYPERCMPSKFRPQNLIELKMKNSKLQKLWEGTMPLPCLRKMDLSGSKNLIEIPDLSKATNLETLYLEECYSLVKLPSSLPHPNKLRRLNLRQCQNLETIPIGISLKSLEILIISGCSRLKTFPQISANLLDLCIVNTAIRQFPSNLRFKKIRYLSVGNLTNKKLWKRQQPLTLLPAMLAPSLEKLYLYGISTLVELPSSFNNLHQLRELQIKKCINLKTLPTGINLQSLWKLVLSGCSQLSTFPDISTNIIYLHVSETGIGEVPWWIAKFSRLAFLEIARCINLETLPNGINLQSLEELHLTGCSRLRTFPDISTNIRHLSLRETGIEEIPSWVKFPRLKILHMNGCHKLKLVRLNMFKLTGAKLSGNLIPKLDIDFTNCVNLDQEALFQQRTYLHCQLRLSGEEVPAYFTYCTNGTSSSSLSIPLLPSSLSQPFLRFRACLVFNCDNKFETNAMFRFRGSFRNSFDSFVQPKDFRADTELYRIWTPGKGKMLILDSRIPRSRDSDVLDLEIDIRSEYKIKEWGIRLLEDFSSADNRLGYPNTLPHIFEADEGNMVDETKEGEEYGCNDMLLNEGQQVENCGCKYVVTETSPKHWQVKMGTLLKKLMSQSIPKIPLRMHPVSCYSANQQDTLEDGSCYVHVGHSMAIE